MLATVIVLIGVLTVAVRAEHATARQRDIADSSLLVDEVQALGDTNATISQIKSIAAWTLDPSPQSRYAMLAAAASPQIATITTGVGEVSSLAVSPNGKILATSTGTNPVQLWDLATAGRSFGTWPPAA